MLRGLGVTSREPSSCKRQTDLHRLHNAAHFPIGCEKWDERGVSSTHATYVDHGVKYTTQDAPDQNASAVELRQGLKPEEQYRTENREHYLHHGVQQREQAYRHNVKINLGSAARNFVSHSKATHDELPHEEAQRTGALRAAGAGLLVPTGQWPKPVRCNPITGAARNATTHDICMAEGAQFKRISNNVSEVVSEAHVRNPLLGHCTPREATIDHTSSHAVTHANAAVPPLRSLGSVRPQSGRA